MQWVFIFNNKTFNMTNFLLQMKDVKYRYDSTFIEDYNNVFSIKLLICAWHIFFENDLMYTFVSGDVFEGSYTIFLA